MFDIVLQLSCSYIAGVIIYILTTLIAEVARAREIQGKITSYVRIIRSHLKDYLDGFAVTYLDGGSKDAYVHEDFVEMEKSFNSRSNIERIKEVKNNQFVKYSCVEWLQGLHITFNKDFEELYKNITELDQYLEKATSSEN